MAETFGFYDTEELVDGTYDREYIAQQWADYFKLFIGTGVFASPTNQLKVVAGEGMNIIIKEGWAFIEGRWYHNDADLIIPVQPNTTASTITSGVFIQADSSDRVIKAIIATGRTTPDREAPYYELELAQIQLATGTTSITNSMITDMRTDESVCGFVKGLLEGVIPTADLFLQYRTSFVEWMAAQDSEFTQWYSEHTDAFNTWFNSIKGQLSTDAAGHLQNEIDDVDARSLMLKKSIAPTEETAVADNKHTKGDYFFVDEDEKLYQALADINANDDIVPGQNAEELTIGEALQRNENTSKAKIKLNNQNVDINLSFDGSTLIITTTDIN